VDCVFGFLGALSPQQLLFFRRQTLDLPMKFLLMHAFCHLPLPKWQQIVVDCRHKEVDFGWTS